MAKVKVYSRLPQPIEIDFYTQGAGGDYFLKDADRIILNGTTEVVNHTLITHDGAVTIFGYPHHDIKKREYPLADLERMKEHPVFKALLKAASISLGVPDDLSRDFDGSGKLTDAELRDRMNKATSPDGEKADFKIK